MHITARLASTRDQEDAENHTAADQVTKGAKDIRMSGIEYAAIKPGDLSPGAMNIETEASSTDGAAAAQ